MKPSLLTYLLMSVLFIIAQPAKSQRYLRKGDNAFEREQYQTAINHYKKQFEIFTIQVYLKVCCFL